MVEEITLTKERCEAGIDFALTFNGIVELERPTYLALCRAALKSLNVKILPDTLTPELQEKLEHLLHNAHYLEEPYNSEEFYAKLCRVFE